MIEQGQARRGRQRIADGGDGGPAERARFLLDGVTFAISPSSLTGPLGQNGAGRITLLSLITLGLATILLLLTRAEDAFEAASPYPRSNQVKSTTWHQNTRIVEAIGSDQFATTWGPDGNIWTAWGDGCGFGECDEGGPDREFLGVSRIEGMPPNLKFTNVWGGLNSLSSQATSPGKPNGGLIAIDGTIYLYYTEQDKWERANLFWSNDLGMTWQQSSKWLFEEPVETVGQGVFTPPTIIQFGRAYQEARDTFVYGYGHKHQSVNSGSTEEDLYLFRVPKHELRDRDAYEFFVRRNADGSAEWTSNIQKMKSVFTDPNGVEWGPTAQYIPHLKRYWLITRYGGYSTSGMFGIFDAPEPWGPWTTVGYGADFPDWTHAPAEKDRPAFMRTFPLKWISKTGNDELTMWNIYDRGDRFNLVKVTLQLNDDVLADDTHR